MLAALKAFLRFIGFPILYIGGAGVFFYSILKEAKWGLFLLVFLIPQPNIWYKFHEYPLGKDYIDFLFFGIALGIIVQKKGFLGTLNGKIIVGFIVMNYFSLWVSSMNFSLGLPITTSNSLLIEYKNYAEMIALYFLALNVAKEEKSQKILLVIICITLFLIAYRNYSNFSSGETFRWERRAGGPFERVNLGANHMGAFFAHYGAMVLGILLFEKNWKLRMLCLLTVVFSLHPLFYSYSRGAYIGALAAIAFFGIWKKRSMLILAVAIVILWRVLLPVSVVDRINMTVQEDGQIEHSAGGRPDLWKLAYDLFRENPVVGVGFGGYPLSVGGSKTERGDVLNEKQDVHSIYMRILCEQGIVGFLLFLLVLGLAFNSGRRLYNLAKTALLKGLGFGFMGCVVAVAFTNMFGDRWSYFVLGGYFWVLWGLVDRAVFNCSRSPDAECSIS